MTIYKRPANILLVEDNTADIELLCEALERERQQAQLFVVSDAEEALDFLEQRGKHLSAARPDIILLDVGLPGMNGKELLSHIKTSPSLGGIPVIILSDSSSDQEVLQASHRHANCYVPKPTGFDNSMHILQTTIHFWLEVARLPGNIY